MEDVFEIELDGIIYTFDNEKLDMVKDWLDMNADEVRG